MDGETLARDAMLAGLHEIRLPETAPGGVPAEIAVVLALAIALALAVAWLLARMARPRPLPAAAPDLPARIAALRALPDEARALALLRLLPPGEGASLRARLYERGGHPGPEELESLLLARGARDA